MNSLEDGQGRHCHHPGNHTLVCSALRCLNSIQTQGVSRAADRAGHSLLVMIRFNNQSMVNEGCRLAGMVFNTMVVETFQGLNESAVVDQSDY